MAEGKGYPTSVRRSDGYGVYTRDGVYMGEVVGRTPEALGDHVRATGMRGVRTVITIDHARKHVIIR